MVSGSPNLPVCVCSIRHEMLCRGYGFLDAIVETVAAGSRAERLADAERHEVSDDREHRGGRPGEFWESNPK